MQEIRVDYYAANTCRMLWELLRNKKPEEIKKIWDNASKDRKFLTLCFLIFIWESGGEGRERKFFFNDLQNLLAEFVQYFRDHLGFNNDKLTTMIARTTLVLGLVPKKEVIDVVLWE